MNLIFMILLQTMLYIIMDLVLPMNMLLNLVYIFHQMIAILFIAQDAFKFDLNILQDLIQVSNQISKLYIYII